jgi:hypothetical protein
VRLARPVVSIDGFADGLRCNYATGSEIFDQVAWLLPQRPFETVAMPSLDNKACFRPYSPTSRKLHTDRRLAVATRAFVVGLELLRRPAASSALSR